MSAKHGLFEVLAGEFADGRSVPPVAGQADLRLSIVDHLTRLLNSRRGALAHLPEHGLPDIAQVYQGLPYSVDELVESIRRTIARFEPRLNRVDVRYEPVDKGNCVLQLEIDAYLGDGERVYFDTYFMSGGYAEVRPTRRRH